MPYVEPVIPGGSYEEIPNTTPKPLADGLSNMSAKRAIGNTFFKLPTYNLTNDVPLAAYILGARGQSARIYIEAAVGATAGAKIVRFWQDGTWPTKTTGIPLKDGESYIIEGIQSIKNARFVSTDGLQHIIQVQFFNQ